MIDTGQRDKLVTIQQLTESGSASKFNVESWTSLVTVFMARRDASARERFTADQFAAENDVVWTLFYRADMDPESIDVPKRRRLIYRGRAYDITGARPVGFQTDIELTTRASSAVGA